MFGKRAKLYEKREQLLGLGAASLELLTEITHTYSKLALQHVEALYELLVHHGDASMRRAIERAVRVGDKTVDGAR